MTTDPEVIEVDFSQMPVMTVNISGDLGHDVLKEYAEKLQDDLEDIFEIQEVKLKGTMDREIEIAVDIVKMSALELSFSDIENAVRSENVTMSGGEILKNDFRRTIRIVGEFKDARELENIIVKSENQRLVYLKDVADCKFTYQERTSIARSDGLPVISLDIIKRSGENLLDASDKIKLTTNNAVKAYLPSSVNVQFFNDQSKQTRDMVENLENSVISGVILVVLVLLFFLGLRNASFVGLAIPLSMLMGIMIVSIIGWTLNMMVLFSLILALGMLVDNAIVVVENIYRYRQMGYDGPTSAKKATGEVAVPIIASTATTLAAFLPMVFWPGLMGSFMKILPVTLIIVLASSLFVALVINPVITSRYMKIDEKAEDRKQLIKRRKSILFFSGLLILGAALSHFSNVLWMRNILSIAAILGLLNFFILRPASFFFQNRILPLLEKGYNRFIRFALNKYNPLFIFIGTIGLLIFTFILLGIKSPKVEYFPKVDPLFVNAFVELPMGKDIENTNSIMRTIEEKVNEAIEPYDGIVEAVLSQIGENTSDPAGPPEFGASPNKARLTVSFVPSEDRGSLSTWDAMEDIRKNLGDVPGVQIVVDKNQDGPPTEKPINIEVTGDDIGQLAELTEDMINFINKKNIRGIEELLADVKLGKPELIIDINRESARRYGASTFMIADVIRTAVFGKEVSKYKIGEDEYPINVRADKKYRYNIDDLLNQKITFRSQSSGQIHQVPISAVANIQYSSTYNSINRKDQKRVITIYSNLESVDYNANEVVGAIQDVMEDYEMPPGFSYKFTGEQEQQAAEMQFLSMAMMIAVFLIFLILVAQFNSLLSPFIIILAIVFSTIGVFLGYVLTGMDFVIIMTGIGIISLAGIVVNNAIVLIDYINILISRKKEELGVDSINQLSRTEVREAIIEGGATRLRPVLLTAITTILGLIPLAIGFNFNFRTFISDLDPQFFLGGDNVVFWGVMAWTVIYGLIFATFLTLVVVPSMYWLAYRLKSLFSRKKTQEINIEKR